MDIFDLFDDDRVPERYHVATWQHGSCHRVTAPGGSWPTITEAVEAACQWGGVDASSFDIRSRDFGAYSSKVYREGLDVIVVIRDGHEEVAASAPLGGDWSPPGA